MAGFAGLLNSARGYPLTPTMPDTMSLERRELLIAYGAKLVRTEGVRGMSGAVAKAEAIVTSDPARYVQPALRCRRRCGVPQGPRLGSNGRPRAARPRPAPRRTRSAVP